MKKNKIFSDYKKKINLLKRYNEFYFDKNDPLVEDSIYDELKKQILILENKYKFLNEQDSVSKLVGFKPSKNFKKSTHKVPMLSLSNAFSEEDLLNFEKKIINFLSLPINNKIYYSAEPKIDGISASITFKNGKFHKGLSRGDGKEEKILLKT